MEDKFNLVVISHFFTHELSPQFFNTALNEPPFFFFFFKDGMFSNKTTGLSHLRSEVISDQLSLKKDNQVIKF
jgi:hypothetical protein